MNYKIFNFLFFLLIISCVPKTTVKELDTTTTKSFFQNKGFALVYNEKLYNEKIVKGKIDDRSLIIFQKNLKKNTSVRVTNLLNSKYVIAKVENKYKYPFFYNSVISKRIKEDLELDESEPYIEIKEVVIGDAFVAKKAKTFEEEKNVADKAPVDEIKIKNLGEKKKGK